MKAAVILIALLIVLVFGQDNFPPCKWSAQQWTTFKQCLTSQSSEIMSKCIRQQTSAKEWNSIKNSVCSNRSKKEGLKNCLLKDTRVHSNFLDFSIVEDYNGILLESAQIDLEFTKQLLPSPTRSDIIAKHLAAIRTQFPKMKDINHDSKWMAGRLITTNCKKTIDECIELINASEYGPMQATLVGESCDSFLFSFEKPYNPEILGPMIADLCECSTEPSSFGVDGTIEINVFGENEAKYTFSIAFEKSSTGHTYKHFWKYSVTGQGVHFVVHMENEWEKDSS